MEGKQILPDFRIAIFGLGLMGGSLAMALRGKCKTLLGIDPDPEARGLAEKWAVVDRVEKHPQTLLPEADLVILAMPVRGILEQLVLLPDLHPGAPVVMDLGSTKTQVLQAMKALPDRFDPIGAHPMTGKERSGLKNADPELYRDAPFALTPLPRTSERARSVVLELVQVVGAKAIWLESGEHDRWVSATSHLPYLVANTLAAVTPLEAAPLAGPGFRSTARLAPSKLVMMLDILATNREHILDGVRNYRKQLDALENALVAQDFDNLKTMLAEGAKNYDLVTGYPQGEF